ncbi:MAG: DEAD/DEAH box helicase [Actinomycetota bacterium]
MQQLTEAGTFEELHVSSEVVERLKKSDISAPFPIQSRVIPPALEGRDVFGQAETGSGKTLAFAIPIIERAPRKKGSRPFALVMVPTRELPAQVADEIKKIGGNLRTMSAYGGTPVVKDIQRLEKGVDVVVATPGRLADLYERGALVLDQISILVLDEADRMLDLGFVYDMDWLIRKLPAARQTMLFSATLPPSVRQLARRYTTDAEHVEIVSTSATVESSEHHFFVVHALDKFQVLLTLLEREPRTIVFVSTKRFAAKLESELRGAGIAAAGLHGDMRQGARTTALARFSAGKASVLVASDVAARGLDVEAIAQVINYDPPQDPTTYLHRSGRTARAGAPGLVVTLCTSKERGHVNQMLSHLHLDAAVEEVFSTSEVLRDLAS